MSDEAIADITRHDRNGVSVVQVEGEVDLTNADALERAVEEIDAGAVVLDLSGVAYLDSSGIRAIDRGHRHLARDRRSLLIVSPPHSPSDWTFRVAGFDRTTVLDSLEAALAAAGDRDGRGAGAGFGEPGTG
jgi:anti-anti-sigma factor